MAKRKALQESPLELASESILDGKSFTIHTHQFVGIPTTEFRRKRNEKQEQFYERRGARTFCVCCNAPIQAVPENAYEFADPLICGHETFHWQFSDLGSKRQRITVTCDATLCWPCQALQGRGCNFRMCIRVVPVVEASDRSSIQESEELEDCVMMESLDTPEQGDVLESEGSFSKLLQRKRAELGTCVLRDIVRDGNGDESKLPHFFIANMQQCHFQEKPGLPIPSYVQHAEPWSHFPQFYCDCCGEKLEEKAHFLWCEHRYMVRTEDRDGLPVLTVTVCRKVRCVKRCMSLGSQVFGDDKSGTSKLGGQLNKCGSSQLSDKGVLCNWKGHSGGDCSSIEKLDQRDSVPGLEA
ncbi:hypothetical protein BJ508DRAFT_328295 [Ascobolus immersus RN42]|uniref:Uncharacterized protein n=1 Tax=Ascobolus immersus RN42 TaxID=1160509 RepID=A0A3N4HZV5_ASCIM|nr:hypothetical protein BJ508DRAFT_328295 [Ascobolus immersus RN42]